MKGFGFGLSLGGFETIVPCRLFVHTSNFVCEPFVVRYLSAKE